MGQKLIGLLDKSPLVELTAICDINEDIEHLAHKYNCAFYNDYEAFLDSDSFTALIVSTPHRKHIEQTIKAVKKRINVFIEKPLSTNYVESLKLGNLPEIENIISCVNLSNRHRKLVKIIKQIISSKCLGEISHFSFFSSRHFRGEKYFNKPWRGSWKHEGGGILINQCIHDLDLICHLFGLPDEVFSLAYRRLNQSEVENEVAAMLSYKNNISANLFLSVLCLPCRQSLEIYGSQGSLISDLERNIRLYKHERDISELSKDFNSYKCPRSSHEKIEFISEENEYDVIWSVAIENFLKSIKGEKAVNIGIKESQKSLMLANSLLLSAVKKEKVNLPFKNENIRDLFQSLENGTSSLTKK